MATFLQAIGRTPPGKAAPDESTLAYTTLSTLASELKSEGVDSLLPRELKRSSSLANPLASPSSMGRRGRLADPPRVASSSLPKLRLSTQAKVLATPALLAVVAARPETPRVIWDLQAGLRALVEADNAASTSPPTAVVLLSLLRQIIWEESCSSILPLNAGPSLRFLCKEQETLSSYSCMGTLQAVQVAAWQVLNLRRPRHIHVEGRKARLVAAVTQLTYRQAHFDWEVLVEQRAATTFEGGRNSAAVLAPLLLNLTTEVYYNSALLHHFGDAPPISPPPLPAHEGLVLMESKEEEKE
ncbi:MAG: hypothetical protein M1840_008228 [Geoglossum simile]|nr:MAG: hypothetical protein M1840_008228 [Geoglossum simile]